jgi:hypothetical protein
MSLTFIAVQSGCVSGLGGIFGNVFNPLSDLAGHGLAELARV